MSQNEAERVNTADNTKQNEAEGMKASGESHKMSIAIVIGSTIGVIGLILLLYGLFGGTSYSRSDNININLWWGLLMVVFGIIMAGGNYLATRMRLSKSAQA